MESVFVPKHQNPWTRKKEKKGCWQNMLHYWISLACLSNFHGKHVKHRWRDVTSRHFQVFKAGYIYEPAWQLYRLEEPAGAEVKLLLITAASEVWHILSAPLTLQVLFSRYTPIKYSLYTPMLIWMCITIRMHWSVPPCQYTVYDNTCVIDKGWRKITISDKLEICMALLSDHWAMLVSAQNTSCVYAAKVAAIIMKSHQK